MRIKLNQALCRQNGRTTSRDVFINDCMASFAPKCEGAFVELDNCIYTPGFLDVHVHLREPGFSYKETIASGTAAAARGGYTDICSMPNLSPCPDNYDNLKAQLDIIDSNAVIGVHPYGTITLGEQGESLSDMEAMLPYVCGFSDDGRGVQDDSVMLCAMKRVKKLGSIIAAHCEDNSLLLGGYINKCEYQEKHGHRGISDESEWRQIERDIGLVRQTGCKYHVCHISTAKSVDLIRKAKLEGLPVSCETAPHYLVLCDDDLCEDARFKMNPPLRSREDRLALLEGVCDGTIDMISTDHAPHSDEEKSKGLEKSPMGVVGLETAFAVLYTELVKKGVIALDRLLDLMIDAPSRIFGIGRSKNSFSVIKLDKQYKIDSSDFLSMGHSTPFDGREVFGECILTVCNGRTVWQSNMIKK